MAKRPMGVSSPSTKLAHEKIVVAAVVVAVAAGGSDHG
jgi:hypothetical protein